MAFTDCLKVYIYTGLSHQGENGGGNEEGAKKERQIATFLDDDTISAQVKDAFSSQVILGWENDFQGRFSIRWTAISTPEDSKIPQDTDELEQSMLV